MQRFRILFSTLFLTAALCAATPDDGRERLLRPVPETALQVLQWLDGGPSHISERMIEDFSAALGHYSPPAAMFGELMVVGYALRMGAPCQSMRPEVLQAFLKRHPNTVMLRNNAAWGAYRSGDLATAVQLAKPLARRAEAQRGGTVQDTLAMIALAEGRKVWALHRMIEALERNAEDESVEHIERLALFAHAAEVFFANDMIVPAYWCWTLADNLRTHLLEDAFSGDAELSAVCDVDTEQMHRKARAIAAYVVKLRRESRLQMPPVNP